MSADRGGLAESPLPLWGFHGKIVTREGTPTANLPLSRLLEALHRASAGFHFRHLAYLPSLSLAQNLAAGDGLVSGHVAHAADFTLVFPADASLFLRPFEQDVKRAVGARFDQER